MHRIAVVGCGGMSQEWISIASKRDDCRIVALVDVMTDNAYEKKKSFDLDAQVFSTLGEALDKADIDLVFDVTPPEYHYNTVSTALRGGCDVFGEKPMADSLEQCKRLVEVAKETGKTYSVMQNRRYNPSIKAFADFIDSGEIGEIEQLSADFFLGAHFGGFRDEMDSPLVADMAIHTFDQARFIFKKKPVSVFCKEFNPSWSWYKGNASAICVFEMEDGSVFDYRGSWCSNGLDLPWESQWRAGCSGGSAFWNGDTELYYDKVDLESKDFTRPSKRGMISCKEDQWGQGHLSCINEMFDALKKGIPAQTDCKDNLISISMVYKATESSRTNKVVQL